MSYQVLARKYRPHSFQEMVGQEHVLRALINSLNQDRLHHAYLFTGTRGVGKTSLARLLAKCFNCEKGVSANPCDACSACQEIDSGRFIDLLEVDAASRTKVEDTRELLENVQYAPTRGRYKVYLIDEVHMLSGHSFNALLKTLEEPPPHVKFLLATTDPQRLPVTVLSRCLQFNLKNLSLEQIHAQLANILQQEKIPYESAALQPLARAANGSMRDALSLLDQAIAYSGDQLQESAVRAMLGAIEQTYILQLLAALAANDGQALFSAMQQLAEQVVDFTNALEELLTTLHQIAVLQIIPTAVDSNTEHYAQLQTLAEKIAREDVQLYYQIALIGRRDLALAPSPRSGFEMILLRMLAFQPVAINESNHEAASDAKPRHREEPVAKQSSASTPPDSGLLRRQLHAMTTSAETAEQPVRPQPIAVAKPVPTPAASHTSSNWVDIIAQLNLTGFTQALAINCTLKEQTDSQIQLELDPNQSALHNPRQETRLAEALSTYFGKPIKLAIRIGTADLATPARMKQQQRTEQLQAATQTLTNDPNVQMMIKLFDAKLQTDSITET